MATSTHRKDDNPSENKEPQVPLRLRLSPAYFAGATGRFLFQASSDAPFLNAVGMVVIAMTLFSAAGVCIILGFRLHMSPVRLWPVGIGWFILLTSVERVIQMLITRRSWWMAPSIVLRIAVPLLIAYQIAQPFALIYAGPEVAQQVQQDKEHTLESQLKQFAGVYTAAITKDESQIASMRKSEDGLAQQAEHYRFLSDCEARDTSCSQSHQLTCGPRCRNDARLADQFQKQHDALVKQDTPLIDQLNTDITAKQTAWGSARANAHNQSKQPEGVIARVRALDEIERQDPSIATHVNYFLILFIVFDLIALLSKLLYVMAVGRPAYEAAVEGAREQDCLQADKQRFHAFREHQRAEYAAQMGVETDRALLEAKRDHDIREGKTRLRRQAADARENVAEEPDEQVRPIRPEEANGEQWEMLDRLRRAENDLRAAKQVLSDRPLKGRYELIELIGTGGDSAVWRALDRKTNEEVAVKIIRDDRAHDMKNLRRLRKEWQIVNSLKHPNIVRVRDYFEEGGRPHLVLDLVDGRSLKDVLDMRRLRKLGGLPIAQVHALAVEIGMALAEAHRNGVIHEDLKPGNILTDDNGAYLTDFGIAREAGRTVTSPMGTPAYAAPEQAVRGRQATPASDVYSLSAVLWEMLTLERPFESGEPPSVARLRALAPTAPPSFAEIVVRGLSFSPEARPVDAGELVRLLTNALATESIFAPPIRVVDEDADTEQDTDEGQSAVEET